LQLNSKTSEKESRFIKNGWSFWATAFSLQLILPQFIKDRLSDLEVYDRHLPALLRELAGTPDGIGRGQVVDVSGLFFRYTLDSATDFLLGRSVNSLDHPQDKFSASFGEVQRLQTAITRMGQVTSIFLQNQKSNIS
jgi:hypothetical protein